MFTDLSMQDALGIVSTIKFTDLSLQVVQVG